MIKVPTTNYDNSYWQRNYPVYPKLIGDAEAVTGPCVEVEELAAKYSLKGTTNLAQDIMRG